MLEESIRMIQEAEQQAEQDKITCRAELQRMLAEAKAEAAARSVQVEETLRRERQEQFARAEEEAGDIRCRILEETQRECDLLRARAMHNREQALEYILTKGV